MTSFAFMLDWVPEPVCHTTSGKWSTSLREATSSAACWMALPSFGSASCQPCSLKLVQASVPSPNFMLTVAAAPFKMPNARTIGGGMRSWGWLILKFSSDRSVWAPQYLSEGTWSSPKASLSVRVLAMLLVMLNRRRWKKLWVLDGVYLVGWRGTVESGRALRVHMTEGLALACGSERIAPASARRRLVRAVRNMVEVMRGDNGGVFLGGNWRSTVIACCLDQKQKTKLQEIVRLEALSSELCEMLPRKKSGLAVATSRCLALQYVFLQDQYSWGEQDQPSSHNIAKP
jgi:hypothetical protein